MKTAFTEAFFYELQSIKNSWYKIFLITLLPLLSAGVILLVFSSSVARDIPIVVVDKDQSKISRKLLSNIDASATIHISQNANSTREAVALLKSSKVYGVVIIPQDFSKNILLQKQPKVTMLLNTQFILVGKILTAAINSVVMHSSAQVEYIKNLVEVQNPQATINSIAPIGIQVTPFFNTYQSYSYFLTSAIIPAIWQIFIVITTLVSIGEIFKYKKEKLFFKDNSFITARLFGLMLPYTIAFFILGLVYIFYFYSRWAFQGSFSVLLLGLLLTVIAYQVIALFLFVTGFDYARSLSLGAVYTAPAFAFLGVTFPVYNMNSLAIFWRDMLPISHYVELQISQANYGADIYLELSKLLSISLFILLFIPVILRFKRRVNR